MIALLLYLVLSALVFLGAAKLLPGFELRGKASALGAAAIYGLLHATLYKVLFWITLPLTLITFGLWVFVLNAVMIGLTSTLLRNMRIAGWGTLLLTAAVLTIAHAIIRAIVF